jgi:apolipoprotein N-acyltransferase
LRIRIFRLLLRITGSVLSGVFLYLAFPEHDMGVLGWFGLVPLFLTIHNESKSYSFLLSLLTGIIFISGIFHWILAVSGYKLYHHSILVFYLALYFGFFGLVFRLIANRFGQTLAFLSAPFLWVSLEYVRSNLFFLALPWALLAHSQHQFSSMIQIVSITGTYGVSFLIVLVNSALAMNIITFLDRFGWQRLAIADMPRGREVSITTLTTIVLITFSITYGKTVLSKPNTGKSIKVSVLQGDIEQKKKRDHKYDNFIMQSYLDLSRKASVDFPALIVWPEAATPGFLLNNSLLLREITNLVKETRTHFLIGSSEHAKFFPDPKKRSRTGNTALHFSPEGKIQGQYLKIHLVPFVEYIPYAGHISWPHFIVPRGRTSGQIQGKEFTLFKIDGTKFGVAICWESLFPGLFRQFVNNGASFMLNISSEAWFGVSAFQYQFLAATKFRAVENRTSIARAGNFTISCFIDPYGRIIESFPENSMDKESFGKGHLTQKITTSNKKTFYTVYGDIFTYIALVITVFVIILALFKTKN